MRELIDQSIFTLFDALFLNMQDLAGSFLADAQAVAAIGMLLYFAVEAYKMMVGDEQLRYMALFRPFALSMVIIFWGGFIEVLNFPLTVVRDSAKIMYAGQIDQVEDLHFQRVALIDSVAIRLSDSSADFEQVQSQTQDKDWMEKMGIDLDPIFDKMKGYYVMLMAKMHFTMMRVVEYIVILLYQVCIYIVFFLQIIFAGILVILGPFAFALSIMPGFRDSYLTWIGRYISVGLYSTIAYIVLSISFVLVKYGLMKEIEILKAVMDNEEMFIAYVSFSSGSISFYIVSLIISGLTMLTIPVISTWIINTSGVGQAIGSIAGGAGKAMRNLSR
ncbi:plasmid transfer protein [Pontibacter diazotrophicus]|uniref:Plasmid transfer protein n=1 Tax=Pontibacter diazotrophicus TaxID=1400979 RepID=A0A3D8L344_9BACT|nr:plasmid transfer protein [Pontibacter diazotrophicus]RDV11889.1 plasmid transfer protein [Pontibacter diazotrophicus]